MPSERCNACLRIQLLQGCCLEIVRGRRGTAGLGIAKAWKERPESCNNIEQKNKITRKGSNT